MTSNTPAPVYNHANGRFDYNGLYDLPRDKSGPPWRATAADIAESTKDLVMANFGKVKTPPIPDRNDYVGIRGLYSPGNAGTLFGYWWSLSVLHCAVEVATDRQSERDLSAFRAAIAAYRDGPITGDKTNEFASFCSTTGFPDLYTPGSAGCLAYSAIGVARSSSRGWTASRVHSCAFDAIGYGVTPEHLMLLNAVHFT